MGASGPQPKPRALRLLEGNRSKRPLPEEPQPRRILPPKPKGMNRRASAIWDYLAPRLQRIDLITEIDGAQFKSLCESEARSEDYWGQIGKLKSLMLENPNGSQYAHPLVGIVRAEDKNVRDLRRTFGLAPSYRVGLAPSGGGSGDDDGEVDG